MICHNDISPNLRGEKAWGHYSDKFPTQDKPRGALLGQSVTDHCGHTLSHILQRSSHLLVGRLVLFLIINMAL